MAAITLTAQQRKALIASKAALDEAQQEINRAKRAGIDVTELQAQLDEARRLRDGLLAEYGGIS